MRIKEIEPVNQLSTANIVIITASSVAGLVLIGLAVFFFYKRNEMKKRALSKDVRDIKQRAANGFEEDSKQTLVQE